MQVARGYLGRPGPDCRAVRAPIRSVSRGARMYRTGDLGTVAARRQPRVPGAARPPGEDPRLPDRAGRDRGGAAAAPGGPRGGRRRRQDVPGDTRLVAYVTAHPGATPPAALRFGPDRRVSAGLYGAIGLRGALDVLPLSPNGKVDRKALPAPDPANAASDKPFAAPRTQTELELARIWKPRRSRSIGSAFRTTTSSIWAATRSLPSIVKRDRQDLQSKSSDQFYLSISNCSQDGHHPRTRAVSHAGGTHPPVGARTDLQTRSFYFLTTQGY